MKPTDQDQNQQISVLPRILIVIASLPVICIGIGVWLRSQNSDPLMDSPAPEAAALALFRSPHHSNGQQASYHVLIGRDGRRIRVVPDEKRAFGAGDSDFQGLGLQLKPGLKPSVNNIALHVSLVSPPDGADGEVREHSGYTQGQYQSLASQIALWQALYGIQPQAVVTHQEVDRSGTRRDPRSFDWAT